MISIGPYTCFDTWLKLASYCQYHVCDIDTDNSYDDVLSSKLSVLSHFSHRE